MQAYVVGFMFSQYLDRVALIRKQKPAWQAGLLNGIGGKIEAGEGAPAAMVREFSEEAGVATTEGQWSHFCTMSGGNNDDGGGFLIEFFTTVDDLMLISSNEAERVELTRTSDAFPNNKNMIENLPWLIAMAIDHVKDGRPKFATVQYP